MGENAPLFGGDMNRVFNSLTVRTIDEDKRIIEGWATTGSVDRVGDVVEPLGAEFDLPIPFLLDHDHSLAVGEVERAEVTRKGIRFVARIKKIPEPGLARELTDKAWHLLKYGLRKSVSIGFQPLEREQLPGGGWRFTRWSWYELSAVSVPANADCVVDGLKRAPGPRVVRLSSREKNIGAIEADASQRAKRRARLGLPTPIVRITPQDLVEIKLAEGRARTRTLRGAGKVRLDR
jgi:hypothetical protein